MGSGQDYDLKERKEEEARWLRVEDEIADILLWDYLKPFVRKIITKIREEGIL